jgi:hypothetical protein
MTRPTAIQERRPRMLGEESNQKPNYVTAVLTACYRSGMRGDDATGGVRGAELGVTVLTCTPHVTARDGGTMTDRTGTGSIDIRTGGHLRTFDAITGEMYI